MSFTDFSSFRFLLVDDFAHYRSMLKSIIRAGGATQIDDASNASDAIEKIDKNQYDVILCDYNLGDGQDGQQILEEVKHRNLLSDKTIFIMVTAENTMAMVMGVVEYRPDEYLSKPFTKDVLKDRLDRVVARRALIADILVAEQGGDFATALRLCNQRMKEHRNAILDLARLKGRLLQKAGALENALQHYDSVIKAANAPWARLGRAHVLLELGRFADAEDALKDLLASDQQLIEAYDLLADALLEQGHDKEAEAVLIQATKVSPKSVKRHQKLSRVASQNGNVEIAERAAKAAIREGRYSYFGSVDDHLALARIYTDKNDLRRLLNVTSHAAERFKKDKQSKLLLKGMEAFAYAKAGQEKQALPLLEKIIRDLPDDIRRMPKQFTDDLVLTCKTLGEEDIAEFIEEDINNGGKLVGESKQRYQSLLLNSEGVRWYKTGNLRNSIHNFEKAAEVLDDRISINLNAAQALIVYMQQRGPEKDLLERSRTYLDRCMTLDAHNKRYQQLEQLYQQIA